MAVNSSKNSATSDKNPGGAPPLERRPERWEELIDVGVAALYSGLSWAERTPILCLKRWGSLPRNFEPFDPDFESARRSLIHEWARVRELLSTYRTSGTATSEQVIDSIARPQPRMKRLLEPGKREAAERRARFIARYTRN